MEQQHKRSDVVIICPKAKGITSLLAKWCGEYARILEEDGAKVFVLADTQTTRESLLEALSDRESGWVLVYLGHGTCGSLVRQYRKCFKSRVETLLTPGDLETLNCMHAYGFCCYSAALFKQCLEKDGRSYLGFLKKCYAYLRTSGDKWRDAIGAPLRGIADGFSNEHEGVLREAFEGLRSHFSGLMEDGDPEARLHLMALNMNLKDGNLFCQSAGGCENPSPDFSSMPTEGA